MLLCILKPSTTAYAAADSLVVKSERKVYSGAPIIDRFAVRTNAVDWIATVPNLGVDFDLNGSEYNNMTVGLSFKYNWDTKHYNKNAGHTYSPPSAFNLFDIRPEFRYWYRTRKAIHAKDKFSVDAFLKDRKHPKTWRANYVGAYANYGTYTFKAGKKGMQGQVIGLGASTGYSLPLYEYEKFAIDIELGFSVGLQACTRDMFAHNPDGYFYTKVLEGSKGMHLTPFPVVSDVRVAFVWRHKSIKDKVKEDDGKNKVIRQFNIFQADYNFNDYTKAWYDETLTNTKSSKEREAIMANDSLYMSGFMNYINEHELNLQSNIPRVFSEDLKSDPRVNVIVKEYEDKLLKLLDKRKKEAVNLFEKELSGQKAEAKKAAAKAEKENPDGDSQKSETKAKGKVKEENPETENAKPEKVKAEKVKSDKVKPEKVKAEKAEKPAKEKEAKPQKEKKEKQNNTEQQ